MSRVFCATGTVRAYFVTDETDIEKIEEIGREVVSDTIEFYGTDECMDYQFVNHSGVDEIPKDDRDKFIFTRSESYGTNKEITVEEAFEDS